MTHESIFTSRFLSSDSYFYVPFLPGHILHVSEVTQIQFFSKSKFISSSSPNRKTTFPQGSYIGEYAP